MHDLLHGGALDRMRAAYPGAPTPWLDLSTGINPWPYPVTDLPDAAFHHLPTHEAWSACRNAMAAAIGAPAQNLLPAPGSELLIRLLPDLIKPQRVAVLSPSYGDHTRVWRAAGCEVIETSDPLTASLTADAVVVCNPNNPDGRRFEQCILEAIRATLLARRGWLIVDEAYGDLAPENSLAGSGGISRLIVLRSFGKFYGLAGVRLGAMIAPPPILNALSDRLGVWPVSGPALAIGTRAYRDRAWQDATRKRLRAARLRLDAILAGAGLYLAGGCDLFRLVRAPDAARIWERLAQQGIYVRRFEWNDEMLRIGLPPDAEGEERLAAALSP